MAEHQQTTWESSGLKPVGLIAQLFLEQIGAHFAINGSPLNDNVFILPIEPASRGAASLMVAARAIGLTDDTLLEFGIIQKSPDGSRESVNIGLLRQLAKFKGIGPVPGQQEVGR